MKKIKIGVLSTANIAKKYLVPNILALDDNYDFVGVASRNMTTAEDFVEDFSGKPFEGYAEIIDHGDIDAIYIPLPNALHYEWIKYALKKNIHVLVEKSLTCSAEETKKLSELALKKELILMENFQFRFHSQLEYVKELINSNKYGELRLLRSSFGFPPLRQNDIRYKKVLGGGSLLDAGAYPIKISQILLGNDLIVKSAVLNKTRNSEVDIFGSLTLESKTKKTSAQLSFGFDNYYQCNLELWFQKAKITAKRIFTAPPGYKPTLIIEAQDNYQEITLPADNHFKKMLLYFHKLIQEKDYKTEYYDNINQARLIEEVKLASLGDES